MVEVRPANRELVKGGPAGHNGSDGGGSMEIEDVGRNGWRALDPVVREIWLCRAKIVSDRVVNGVLEQWSPALILGR